MQEQPVPVLTITVSMALLKQVTILACNKATGSSHTLPAVSLTSGGWDPQLGGRSCSWLRAAEDTNLTCSPWPFSPRQEPKGVPPGQPGPITVQPWTSVTTDLLTHAWLTANLYRPELDKEVSFSNTSQWRHGKLAAITHIHFPRHSLAQVSSSQREMRRDTESTVNFLRINI